MARKQWKNRRKMAFPHPHVADFFEALGEADVDVVGHSML